MILRVPVKLLGVELVGVACDTMNTHTQHDSGPQLLQFVLLLLLRRKNMQ